MADMAAGILIRVSAIILAAQRQISNHTARHSRSTPKSATPSLGHNVNYSDLLLPESGCEEKRTPRNQLRTRMLFRA